MCWSAEVSWAFACIDMVFIAILLYQKHGSSSPSSRISTRFHGTYATFLAAISMQEWAQYLVWKRDNLDPQAPKYCSEPMDYILSFVVMASAQSVPIVLMLSNVISAGASLEHEATASSAYQPLNRKESNEMKDSRSGNTTIRQESQKWLWQAALSWLTQFVIILICVAISGEYCVKQGANHHQVWICASAVYETGGYPLYFLSLLLFIYSGCCALQSHTTLPQREKEWIGVITLTNGVIAYGIYCWTLEACSIWCWAAFTFGIYFCTKDYYPALMPASMHAMSNGS